MIRFINLTDQIDEGKLFAFFDTITMQFITTGNNWCVWKTIKEFEEDYRSVYTHKGLDRFLNLIPDDWE
ncbi:hypothetical protein [Pedobacter sp.]|uniref:hypothetical protein n=1 Tax=Pedobacter sp. TaxID=1411316 RepID=UPI00396C2EA2